MRAIVRENVPLSGRTTLRIGGPARFFVEVHDVDALAALLDAGRAEGLPVLALGKGSNLLVPDAGFPGVVFTLAGDFLATRIEPPDVVAGGGVSLMSLAVATQKAGLSGLENLSGIPSSLGGAVRINAGSYGSEIFDVLVAVDLVSTRGERRTVPASEIPHGYRWTALSETDDVVAGATLRLVPKAAGADRRAHRRGDREEERSASETAERGVHLQESARTLRGQAAGGVRPEGTAHRRRGDLARSRERHRQPRRRDGGGRRGTDE